MHEEHPMASQAADGFLPGSNGQPTATIRHGTTILRPAGPWTTPTVHALLRHLEQVGYPGSPRVVGDGYDDRGREVLTWIEGQIAHPHPYPDEAIFQVGQLLRALHDATASFRPPPRAVWQPWSLRSRAPDAVISHCNVGPWHVIVREGRPVGFIDWSLAGPTDRLEELAASGWWNAQLGFGDDLDQDAPDAAVRRGRQLRLFLDGYGLPTAERPGLVTRMVEFAVRDCAGLAEVKQITPESNDPTTLWVLAWQTRAAAWMLRHRPMLERATVEPMTAPARRTQDQPLMRSRGRTWRAEPSCGCLSSPGPSPCWS
jgi:phosphotransferase family enzyme